MGRITCICATKKKILICWIFLDPGIHFVNLILKILTIFVDTGTTITVYWIRLKFGVWMQTNMYMCNEEEIFDFLDFPGSWDPLCKFYAENLNNFVDTGTTITVHRIHLKFGVWMQDNMEMCNEEENFDLLDFPRSWDPLCKYDPENLSHFCGHGNYHNGLSD